MDRTQWNDQVAKSMDDHDATDTYLCFQNLLVVFFSSEEEVHSHDSQLFNSW